jgi:hypothetical protein
MRYRPALLLGMFAAASFLLGRRAGYADGYFAGSFRTIALSMRHSSPPFPAPTSTSTRRHGRRRG